MIRPSFVLGGRAMMVAYEEEELEPFVNAAFEASPDFPVLIDRFLEHAIEVDVDLVCDGTDVYIGGVMEHVEEAGIHSGDSACSIPPYTLPADMVDRIKEACRRMALELDVRGLMNAQIAVKDDEFYIIEVNPRASRTVPYVSKATNVPLANVATQIAMGQSLEELGLVRVAVRVLGEEDASRPHHHDRVTHGARRAREAGRGTDGAARAAARPGRSGAEIGRAHV